MAKTVKRDPRIGTLWNDLIAAMEHQRDLNSGNFLLNTYLQDGTLANISEKGKKVAESLKKEYLAATKNCTRIILELNTAMGDSEAPRHYETDPNQYGRPVSIWEKEINSLADEVARLEKTRMGVHNL
jgi:hypothetical protein